MIGEVEVREAKALEKVLVEEALLGGLNSPGQTEAHEIELSGWVSPDLGQALAQTELLDQDKLGLGSAPLSLPAALCDDLFLEELGRIPDKMGFKIGDVAELLGIKQYVLRYWESEFEILRPKKAANNQRMYTRRDVENAFLIRKLLHRDRFSIEGARNALKELKNHIRKEKDISQVVNRMEGLQERVEALALEIRKLRQSLV